MIEYAVADLPALRGLPNDVYPQLQDGILDTGKVKFILRPFMRNVLDAVVFMLAEAAGAEKYHDVIETFFKTQDTWAMLGDADTTRCSQLPSSSALPRKASTLP